MVDQIYRNIRDSPVIYSEVEGGKWIAPSEAFLHDRQFPRGQELSEALILLRMPVVHLPNSLFTMITSISGMQCKMVTPDSVRQYLRHCRYTSTIDRSYKLMLLEYCLDDLIDSDVGSYAFNLPLLPLANGDFGLISEASKGISYFICTNLEYMLLQKLSDRLIDQNIPPNVASRLLSIAKALGANLMVFSINDFLPLFSMFVPIEWKYRMEVQWDPNSNSNHPTESWFMLFWHYLQNQCSNLSLFDDWPILPSLSSHLYRPSKQSKLLNLRNLSNEMQLVLVKTGCKILNDNYGIEHPDLLQYLYSADGSGVLKSIFDVVSSCETIEYTFSKCLEPEDRDEIFFWIQSGILVTSWMILTYGFARVYPFLRCILEDLRKIFTIQIY